MIDDLTEKHLQTKEQYPKEIVVKERQKGLWQRFDREVLESDAVVCGEYHGSRENWEVYRFLLGKGSFGGFAYELPIRWQEHVRNSIYHGKPFPDGLLDIWLGRNGKHQHDDGKISREFIGFLNWFSKFQKGLPLIFFDASSSGKRFSWNDRDKGMFNNLMKERKDLDTSKPLLIGCGGLHARTAHFRLNREVVYPLAHHLSQQLNTISVPFKYLSGRVMNIKEKAMSDKRYHSNLPSFLLNATSSHGYEILIKKSHPIQLL